VQKYLNEHHAGTACEVILTVNDTAFIVIAINVVIVWEEKSIV
jgi:hypothetical protein